MYAIEFVEEAIDELNRLTAGVRKRVLDEIEKQLEVAPLTETRRKRLLVGLSHRLGIR